MNLTYTLTEKIGGNVIFHLYFNNASFVLHPIIDFWLKFKKIQYFSKSVHCLPPMRSTSPSTSVYYTLYSIHRQSNLIQNYEIDECGQICDFICLEDDAFVAYTFRGLKFV